MIVKKSDNAISPVIGIMLMLAVTLIIAAAVVAISTGMMTDTEPAPTAKLDITIDSARYKAGGYSAPYYVPDLLITHVSGDPLNTANLRLTFSWDCGQGSSCPVTADGHHFSTYAYEDKPEGYANGLSESQGGLFGNSRIYVPSGYEGTLQPLYINSGSMKGRYFGSFTMTRGETLYAFTTHLVEDWSGDVVYHHKGNPAMDIILNNGEIITESFESSGGLRCEDPYGSGCTGTVDMDMSDYGMGWVCSTCWATYTGPENPEDYIGGGSDTDPPSGELTAGIMACLEAGTPVDVKVIHIPSNKPIYSKTVYVQ